MGAPSLAPHLRPILSCDNRAHHLLLLAHPSSHLLFFYPPDFSFFSCLSPSGVPETGQTKHTPAPGVGSCCGREKNRGIGYVLVGMHPPLALVFWGIDAGRTAPVGPKGKLTWTEAGSSGQKQLWAGTNRAPVCFFPSAAAASRPGAVFSVEGAPENRAGKCSLAAHLPCPRLGS